MEEIYFEGKYGNPFREEPQVTEYLKTTKMVTPPAPLPWRKEEVKALAQMFGLPE